MPSRTIRSLEEGQRVLKEEQYLEDVEPLQEEIRAIEQRLNVYGASAHEAVLPALRYWREHFRDRLEEESDPEKRVYWQGACHALRQLQDGRAEIEKELAAKMTELNEVRGRYGMEL